MKNYDNSYDRWLNKRVFKKELVFNPKLQKEYEKINSELCTYDTCYSICDDRNVLKISYKLDISKSRRPTIGVRIPLNIKGNCFNRVRVKAKVEAKGLRNLYMHYTLKIGDKYFTHAPSLKVNEWEDIIFEVNHMNLSEATLLTINPFMGGRPIEAKNDINVYIGEVYFEKVEAEYELGYEIGDRIAYSQLGYFNNGKKEFICSKGNQEFEILRSNKVVFKGITKEIKTSIGVYGIGDFSELKENGFYKIRIGKTVTPKFEIGYNPYSAGLDASLYFLYQLRCGEVVEKVHGACHLNSRTYNQNGDSVPNFGGWHDAGDLSQFEIPTAEIAASLLELHLKTIDEVALLEAQKGVDWLLRTTFHNGERALAVLYEKWWDDILEVDDYHYKNMSENGPFENFLASNALSLASAAYRNIDEIYATYCLDVAIEDFDFAYDGYKKGLYSKRWGPLITSQTAGVAILASVRLFKCTGDEKYKIIAKEFADELISCQETNYIGNSNIRGFFYEDKEHKYILSYEHRGHEEYVTSGLVELAKAFPLDVDHQKWVESLKMYREYILNTVSYTSPYNFLPGHIYFTDKINLDHLTLSGTGKTREECEAELIRQVKEGVRITDTCYLRRMPIAIQRRGFLATLLSKTKAVSSIASFFDDKELKQIVIYQLEHVHGRNPFATSLMYGVGSNYHPLYVAYSLQMPGSLPVGIRTLGDSDAPYWPAYDNAVFKEIWGHTTGKYIAVLADVLRW